MKIFRKLFKLGNAGQALTALITIILAGAALIGIFHAAITNSTEYNRLHRNARNYADNPGSVSEDELLNSGEALVKLMRETVKEGAGAPETTGAGVKLLLEAEEKLQEVRQQKYVIKVVANPAAPALKQGVTITITVMNSITGTTVKYSLVGTDGYKKSGTLATDGNGQCSFYVPGASKEGTVDTVTITVGTVIETFTYQFH